MNVVEGVTVDAQPTAELAYPHWPIIRRVVLVAYVAALGAYVGVFGVPAQRELVIAWVVGGLACLSLGRPAREIGQLLIDWLPIVAVLAVYDLTRGAADSLGIAVHDQALIDVDRFLFLGQTPPEWLQANFYDPNARTVLNVAFTLIYTSYFIVPLAVAGVLWIRDHDAFRRYMRRFITLAFAAVVTYILFPAAPPWMASDMGLIGDIQRTTPYGWELIGGGTADLFDKGQTSVNLVAAVPSLHTAMTVLVAMFLWGRVRPSLRPLLALYPVAMGFTLMATGEHWAVDLLLGVLYAGVVMAGWNWWERRRVAQPA